MAVFKASRIIRPTCFIRSRSFLSVSAEPSHTGFVKCTLKIKPIPSSCTFQKVPQKCWRKTTGWCFSNSLSSLLLSLADMLSLEEISRRSCLRLSRVVASRWSSYSCGVACWQKVNAAKHIRESDWCERWWTSGREEWICYWCGAGETVSQCGQKQLSSRSSTPVQDLNFSFAITKNHYRRSSGTVCCSKHIVQINMK